MKWKHNEQRRIWLKWEVKESGEKGVVL